MEISQDEYQQLSPSAQLELDAAIHKMSCKWKGHVWDYTNEVKRDSEKRSRCVRCGETMFCRIPDDV